MAEMLPSPVLGFKSIHKWPAKCQRPMEPQLVLGGGTQRQKGADGRREVWIIKASVYRPLGRQTTQSHYSVDAWIWLWLLSDNGTSGVRDIPQ